MSRNADGDVGRDGLPFIRASGNRKVVLARVAGNKRMAYAYFQCATRGVAAQTR
jgi:hypothetical protein